MGTVAIAGPRSDQDGCVCNPWKPDAGRRGDTQEVGAQPGSRGSRLPPLPRNLPDSKKQKRPFPAAKRQRCPGPGGNQEFNGLLFSLGGSKAHQDIWDAGKTLLFPLLLYFMDKTDQHLQPAGSGRLWPCRIGTTAQTQPMRQILMRRSHTFDNSHVPTNNLADNKTVFKFK